jgi:hypothetical protein
VNTAPRPMKGLAVPLHPIARVQANIAWSRSWEPHVYVQATDGRKGWALVPYVGDKSPDDPDGIFGTARAAAILAAAEAAGQMVFVELDIADYDPSYGADGSGAPAPGWFGTVLRVSVRETDWTG